MATKFTSKDLAAMPPSAPIHWVVEGLLRTRRKRPSLLCGYAEAGKSTLAAQLSIAVAQGTTFLGRSTDKGSVIYWKNEDTQEDVLEDFVKAGMPMDGSITFLLPKMDDDNFEVLSQALKDQPHTKLVIIETLMDFFDLRDVTSNDEGRTNLKNFNDRVVEHYPDCSFLILHHFNKSDLSVDTSKLSITKILGGTAFAAGTDTKIYMQQVSDSDTRRVLLATTRKGTAIEPTYLDFDCETSTSTLGITVKAEAIAAKQVTKAQKTLNSDGKIMQLLTENSGIPKWSLVTLVGGAGATVGKKIDKLIASGLITVQCGAKNAKLLYAAGTEPPALFVEDGVALSEVSL